jgi:hypothetical protein
MAPVQTAAGDWLQIIRGEFTEVPGLRLTKKQVQRLWGLDPQTCDELIDLLVAAKFLRQTDDTSYVRVNLSD